MGRLLESYFMVGGKTLFFTYSDYLKGARLYNILSTREFDIVLIDELDMYIKECSVVSEIEKYVNRTIFLIDLKNYMLRDIDKDLCNVIMRENEIIVVQ